MTSFIDVTVGDGKRGYIDADTIVAVLPEEVDEDEEALTVILISGRKAVYVHDSVEDVMKKVKQSCCTGVYKGGHGPLEVEDDRATDLAK